MMSLNKCLSLFVVVSFLITSFIVMGNGKRPSKPVAKIVCKLSYHKVVEQMFRCRPHSFGIYEDEMDALFMGDFVGVDYQMHFYIADYHFGKIFLKCFDKNGKFLKKWIIEGIIKIAFTKDNYIWIITGIRENKILPIVILHKNKKLPVVDWQKVLPVEVKAKIQSILNIQDLEKYYWSVQKIVGSKDKVLIRLFTDKLSERHRYGLDIPKGILWLVFSSDGKKCLSIEIEKPNREYVLDANGNFWLCEIDYNLLDPQSWQKIWIWKKDENKEKPLIDRTRNKEPWSPYLILGEKVHFPDIYIDAKGNIYLTFIRNADKNYTKKFFVNNEIFVYSIYKGSFGNFEYSLIVLNRKGQMITYLPWTHQPELGLHWIHPLPDGSGFYRIEYREREAVIYFHPLPSQKP
ncbi:hypothetical protein Q2T83_00005 [Fervidibacter sacchari]|uniref:6-bladed beta-propeller n=1 Tax=Candidatus Fervidibacter sacchari TaxID=1448929 RepID=A0ABT2ETJ8_9BACT|nr:hypothetical protein [Candidatus Fervidibacter sacchari]MCS3921289.1 hypothetical protein [Candidatus Fervidibacter sacchari]WKU16243.1 hypothetical protein Q2T83_00005 [Candidatus Fervidibacter sacchari]